MSATRSMLLAILLLCAAGVLAATVARRLSVSGPTSLSRAATRQRFVDPETSCGPVSAAVVANFLDKPGTIAEFHEATHAGDLGVCSLEDLREALSSHGFFVRSVRYSVPPFPKHHLPMILFVDGDHFLVALPADTQRVVIVDPPMEPQIMSWSEICGRWRGEAVVVGVEEMDVREVLSQAQ